jgi:folate-dependent phosphoribosylglycinamide formyltransferase PurN
VLAAGETVTGCTVHLVSEELDSGDIIAQADVPVEPGDDGNALAARVLDAEHRLYPKALSEFVAR